MFKKLVRYDQWHFAEVDPICLKRMAINLRQQILLKVQREDDPYLFYTRTMPIVESAIRGEIRHSLSQDELHFVSSNYYHAKSEGELPASYDQEFTKAVSEFSVTAEALSLEEHADVVVDGITYGWVDFEEEGDWPDKLKYP